MAAYIGGLLLGLVMIVPIGMQNIFVLNQGLMAGFPRVLVAVVGASCCDTLLIVLGATLSTTLVAAVPNARAVLVAVGVVFLLVLGVRSLVTAPEMEEVQRVASPLAVIGQTVGVSLINPHAILDTVGVIGGAIAARQAAERAVFAAGAVTASWCWFLLLGLGAAIFQRYLTARGRLWIARGSGAIMVVFAAILALQLRG